MCDRLSTISTCLSAWLASRSARTAPANPAPTIRKSNPRIGGSHFGLDSFLDQRVHVCPGAIPRRLRQELIDALQPGAPGLGRRLVLVQGRFDGCNKLVDAVGAADQSPLPLGADDIMDRRRDGRLAAREILGRLRRADVPSGSVDGER